jgi:hypothetical protein
VRRHVGFALLKPWYASVSICGHADIPVRSAISIDLSPSRKGDHIVHQLEARSELLVLFHCLRGMRFSPVKQGQLRLACPEPDRWINCGQDVCSGSKARANWEALGVTSIRSKVGSACEGMNPGSPLQVPWQCSLDFSMRQVFWRTTHKGATGIHHKHRCVVLYKPMDGNVRLQNMMIWTRRHLQRRLWY